MQNIVKIKAKPLYTNIFGTILNVGKIEALKGNLPSYKDILEHIIAELQQQVGHKPIEVFLTPDQSAQLAKELRQKTGREIPDHCHIFLYIDEPKNVVIKIILKKDLDKLNN